MSCSLPSLQGVLWLEGISDCPELQLGILAPATHRSRRSRGEDRTVLVSVASRLVSPWSVLAVLLGSPGLQISRLPVLCLAGVARSFLGFLPLPA